MRTPIIDCHTHIYAPEVIHDPRGWGTARKEWEWIRCVAPEGRRSIQGWADVDRLVADMDRAGVDRAVMLGWYWENQDTCELQNSWYLDWMRRHPERLHAFAAIQPGAGQRAVDHLERMLDAGFCGVGELLPQVQRYDYSDAWFHRVLEVAAARQIPVNLHVTDSLAVPESAAPATPLQEIVSLARQFPGVTFILAHWGGGLPFFELNRRVHDALKNVVYDTAASPLSYEPRIFRRVVDLVGPERVLFGSDYPLLLYPREQREPAMHRFLDVIKKTDLSVEELAMVLGGSALRVLGRHQDKHSG